LLDLRMKKEKAGGRKGYGGTIWGEGKSTCAPRRGIFVLRGADGPCTKTRGAGGEKRRVKKMKEAKARSNHKWGFFNFNR